MSTLVLLAATLVLGAEPVRYELEGNELEVPGPVVFATNSDKLKPESDAVLEYVKGYLEAKSSLTLMRVEGHSDSMGDEKANQQLSEDRAAAIVEALVKKGIACERLIAVGFGGTKPVAANDTMEGRAANRRTRQRRAQGSGHRRHAGGRRRQGRADLQEELTPSPRRGEGRGEGLLRTPVEHPRTASRISP